MFGIASASALLLPKDFDQFNTTTTSDSASVLSKEPHR